MFQYQHLDSQAVGDISPLDIASSKFCVFAVITCLRRFPCQLEAAANLAHPSIQLSWVAVKELKLSYHNGYMNI